MCGGGSVWRDLREAGGSYADGHRSGGMEMAARFMAEGVEGLTRDRRAAGRRCRDVQRVVDWRSDATGRRNPWTGRCWRSGRSEPAW